MHTRPVRGSDKEQMAKTTKPPFPLVKKVRSKTFTKKQTPKAVPHG